MYLCTKIVYEMARIKKKETIYRRYLKDGDKFIPIQETSEILPPGFYKPVYDDYNEKAYFTERDVITPNLYILPDGIQTQIMDDIKNFWESEERYKKFGNVYKRNILLYSAPGNGKTSVINLLCKELITKYEGVVILIDSITDLMAYNICMRRLKDVEPNRKIITVIEDFERLTKSDDVAATLLQLLDGNSQFDNIVTIATTNYPQILEKRFVCRPSRFNLVIEYKRPTDEIRRAYITCKLKDGGYDVDSEEVKATIERHVKATQGYTFDFVKELVQGIYVEGLKEEAVLKRLNDIINKNGNVKVTDENGKVGFSDSMDDVDFSGIDTLEDIENEGGAKNESVIGDRRSHGYGPRRIGLTEID